MDRKTANTNLFIIFHLLGLFLLTLLASSKTQVLGNSWVAFFYYLVLVILPVVVFVLLAEHQNPWTALGLGQNPMRGSAVGLLIGGVVLAVFLLSKRFGISPAQTDTKLSLFLIFGTIFAAFAEELLFRGFILPRMMTQMTFIKANILASVLFAGLHAAALLQDGTLIIPKIILLFIISLWLGYLYKKTQSVWTAVWVHVLYNLAILIS